MAAVVLDHAFGWPSGGFLGVDAFFVVSGFVVTASLLRERRVQGTIELRRFAVRRLRRLTPSALLVLAVSVLASITLLPAPRALIAVTDAGWAAVGLANWRFAAAGTDYFARGDAPSPLQHYWSLGVEEQFYVVLPVALVLLLGAAPGLGRLRRTGVVLGLGSVVSLGWAVVASATDPSPAYFSTTTRAWELGLGAVIAVLTVRPIRTPVWAAQTASGVGLLLLLASLVLGRSSDGVPAPLSLAPTVGVGLLLLSGTSRSTVTGRLLSSAPLVGLGTISYSLYLWHWPLIVFLPLVAPVPAVATVALSVALSAVSYVLIERRFRQPRPGPPGAAELRHERFATLAGVVVVAIVLTAVAADRTAPTPGSVSALTSGATADGDTDGAGDGDGDEPTVLSERTRAIQTALVARRWPDRLTPSVEAVSTPRYAESLTTDPAWEDTLSCSRPDTDSTRDGTCTWGAPDGDSVVLVGDSTGAYAAPAWRTLAEDGSRFRVRNTTRIGCPFAAVELPSASVQCDGHNPKVVDLIRRTEPDLLVVTNRFWDKTDPDMADLPQADYEQAVAEMLESVKDLVGTIIVVPPVSPGFDPERCFAGTRGPSDCRVTADLARSQADSLRAAVGSTATVLDTTRLWCAGACPIIIGDTLVRFDPVHVTPDAARESAPALLALLEQAGVVDDAASSGAAQQKSAETEGLHDTTSSTPSAARASKTTGPTAESIRQRTPSPGGSRGRSFPSRLQGDDESGVPGRNERPHPQGRPPPPGSTTHAPNDQPRATRGHRPTPVWDDRPRDGDVPRRLRAARDRRARPPAGRHARRPRQRGLRRRGRPRRRL